MTVRIARGVGRGLVPHLRRARDHIDRHYESSLNLDQLAAVAGVSKYHFVRCFEATYGDTPMRYLTRRRIERAQDLLRSANLTVTPVAVGAGSLTYDLAEPCREGPEAGEPDEHAHLRARRGGPHVPGCYLFMRGTLDPRGTTGPVKSSDDGAI